MELPGYRKLYELFTLAKKHNLLQDQTTEYTLKYRHPKANEISTGQVNLARTMGECVICMEKIQIGHSVREIACGHRFHRECLDTWFQRLSASWQEDSCPLCRFSATSNHITSNSINTTTQQ